MTAMFKPIVRLDGLSQFADLPPTPKALVGSVLFPSLGIFHQASQPALRPLGSPDIDAVDQYNEGVAAGKAQAERIQGATVHALEAALEQLKSSLPDIRQDIESTYSQAVASCLKHFLPELSEQLLRAHMADIIMRASSQNLTDALQAYIHPANQIAKDFLGKDHAVAVQIHDDDAQSETGVKFAWGQSQISLDPSATAQACLTLFDGRPDAASNLIDTET